MPFAIGKRERPVVIELMNALISINNREKEAIHQKYHLGNEDPLSFITELYQQVNKGTLEQTTFKQMKQELLRVI